MRARRSYQPRLDEMPFRITPGGGGTLSAAVGSASGDGSVTACSDTPTISGEGAVIIIIQPVTVPTTLIA